MIDTHCHLTFPDFEQPRSPGGVAAVLTEAARHGVTGAITISTTTQDGPRTLALARAHPRVWCSAGVHPLYAAEGPHDWALMKACGRDPRCVAWGELGLDRHYDDPPFAIQEAVLDEQLANLEAWTREGLVKPVVIHCREAFAELLPRLKQSSLDPARYVFHCFTGTADEARAVLDFGAWISFTGVVTYRNADNVRDAARLAPADRIMVETDAPFLSPDPHRAVRPCSPWMASVTAKRIAELRGTPWPDFHQQINDNTARFFGVE